MSIQGIASSNAAMDAQLARVASQQSGSRQPAQQRQRCPGADGARSNELGGTRTPPEPGAGQQPRPVSPTVRPCCRRSTKCRRPSQPVAQNLLFSIDDDTGRTIVKIVDSQTDEVIRQMPSEEVLAISKAIDKLQGLLIKQQA